MQPGVLGLYPQGVPPYTPQGVYISLLFASLVLLICEAVRPLLRCIPARAFMCLACPSRRSVWRLSEPRPSPGLTQPLNPLMMEKLVLVPGARPWPGRVRPQESNEPSSCCPLVQW